MYKCNKNSTSEYNSYSPLGIVGNRRSNETIGRYLRIRINGRAFRSYAQP